MKKFFNDLVNNANHFFPETLNPVFVKEIRQSLNGRVFLGGVSVLILAGLLFSYLQFQLAHDSDGVFFIYFVIYWVLVLLMPSVVASRWVFERGQDGLTPEYATPLSAFRILNGKLGAIFCGTAFLYLLGLPAFLYLLMNLSCNFGIAGKELCVLFPLFLVPVAMVFVLIAVSSKQTKNARNNASAIGVLGVLLGSMTFFFFMSLLDGQRSSTTYLWLLDALLMILFLSVMLYFCSYAMLLPPRANRMFLPRCVGFVLCLLYLPAHAYFLSLQGNFSLENACKDWGVLLCVYAILSLVMAMGERLAPTERCRASLPQNTVMKLCCRFFSSGAINGLVYGTVILCAGTLLSFVSNNLRFMAGIGFYVLFYSTVTLAIRIRKREWNPVVVFLMIFLVCNLLSLLSIVHPSGVFSMLSITSGIFLKGWNILLTPIYCACAGVLLLIAALRNNSR